MNFSKHKPQEMDATAIILFWIHCAILGGAIGFKKGKTSTGILLGGLFAVPGLIVLLFLRRAR